jgi:hypothetical protein
MDHSNKSPSFDIGQDRCFKGGGCCDSTSSAFIDTLFRGNDKSGCPELFIEFLT